MSSARVLSNSLKFKVIPSQSISKIVCDVSTLEGRDTTPEDFRPIKHFFSQALTQYKNCGHVFHFLSSLFSTRQIPMMQCRTLSRVHTSKKPYRFKRNAIKIITYRQNAVIAGLRLTSRCTWTFDGQFLPSREALALRFFPPQTTTCAKEKHEQTRASPISPHVTASHSKTISRQA